MFVWQHAVKQCFTSKMEWEFAIWRFDPSINVMLRIVSRTDTFAIVAFISLYIPTMLSLSLPLFVLCHCRVPMSVAFAHLSFSLAFFIHFYSEMITNRQSDEHVSLNWTLVSLASNSDLFYPLWISNVSLEKRKGEEEEWGGNGAWASSQKEASELLMGVSFVFPEYPMSTRAVNLSIFSFSLS